jgi:Zn-dependent peptidase ImmA (M78 family)
MSKMSPTVPTRPDVLKWLREKSGWTLDDLSSHTKISINNITRWERGDARPTYNDIVKLADAYKRPTAIFFISRPLNERPFPQDFRRLSGEQKAFTVKTLRAIRKAQNSQLISKELKDNLNVTLEPTINHASLNDDTDKIANFEREKLSFTLEDQTNRKFSDYDIFKMLRSQIESKNILVFQFSMELEELRGLTLLDIKPYAIVVNTSDNIRARIFTLLHEYGHILLNEPSLCTPETPISKKVNPHGASVETWCNRFAADFLLPKDIIVKEYEKYNLSKSLTKYRTIANKYKVSNTMTLVRMRSLGLISKEQFLLERNILKSEDEEEKEDIAHGVKGTLGDQAAREYGNEYISLVVRNEQKGHITYSDALGYLHVKTKDFEKFTR